MIRIAVALLSLLIASIPAAAAAHRALAATSVVRGTLMATTTQQILGPGTYHNSSGTSAAWQPPVCNYVTVTLSQVNTTKAGNTATLSGQFLASQDGVTYVGAGDFQANIDFTDTTQLNKNGQPEVPPDLIFGTNYAPFLKVTYNLVGTITTQGIVLSTN